MTLKRKTLTSLQKKLVEYLDIQTSEYDRPRSRFTSWKTTEQIRDDKAGNEEGTVEN